MGSEAPHGESWVENVIAKLQHRFSELKFVYVPETVGVVINGFVYGLGISSDHYEESELFQMCKHIVSSQMSIDVSGGLSVDSILEQVNVQEHRFDAIYDLERNAVVVMSSDRTFNVKSDGLYCPLPLLDFLHEPAHTIKWFKSATFQHSVHLAVCFVCKQEGGRWRVLSLITSKRSGSQQIQSCFDSSFFTDDSVDGAFLTLQPGQFDIQLEMLAYRYRICRVIPSNP
eukprot:GILI01040793.1.p1 GENE.GILI01040793.1~~GILI01040793.1.p1  ORF type:complete len:229 (+),score=1.54 GILI01040793.1:84-770(+)